jgi:lipopolysaccharide transport system permease protein
MTKIIIKPPKSWINIDFKELWSYKDLLYFFTWRDIKVRYKQTVLGVLWAIFQPFITMIVFSIFFGKFAKMPSDGIPYPIFVYTGLVLWTFFSQALTNASGSMTANQSMIQKIFFPRLLLPISSIFVCLIDLFIASLILVGMMFYYHSIPKTISIIMVPYLIFLTYLISLGLGLFLAAINVKYRDVRYIVPFFIQILLFLTPVIYPVSMLSDKYQWILNLNPMSGVIENIRASVLGQTAINWDSLLISTILALLLFIFGLIYFQKTEKYFADII